MAGELNALVGDKPTPNLPSKLYNTEGNNTSGALNDLLSDSFKTKESNTQRDLDISKYTDYIQTVYPDQDINEQRAQLQSKGAKIGSGVVNAVSQTALDVVKDTSYLLDFRNLTDFQNQADNGFSNFMADAMTKTEESLKLPVYRTKASEGFSPTSAGWWGDNIPSILSTVSMAIPAEGAVMGLSKLGKLLGGEKVIQAIETATGVAGIGDKLGGFTGAVLSRHMESLMEGGQTYQDTYDAAMKKPGMTTEQAKKIAGEAAADNYKMNWVNLATDLPQYMLLHKTFSKSLQDLKFSTAEVAKTIFSESAEEGYQFITNEEAKRAALIKNGVNTDDNTTLTDRLANYAKDGEFWTSVFLGGLGGGVFAAGGSLKNSRQEDKQRELFNQLTNLHTAVVKGDPSDFNRQSDKVFTNAVMTHVAEDRLDDLTTAIKETSGAVDTKEERVETQKAIQERVQTIKFAKDLKDNLDSDQSKSPELKALQLESSIEYKLATKRLQTIDQRLMSLRAEDALTLNLVDYDLHQFKLLKLQTEAIKDMPQFSDKYQHLLKQVDSAYSTILKEGNYKSKKEIDEALISPSDPELTKLLGNKEIEQNQINQLKSGLYKLSIPEGIQELQGIVDSIKEEKAKKDEAQATKEAKAKAGEEAKAKVAKNKEELANLKNKAKLEKDAEDQLNSVSTSGTMTQTTPYGTSNGPDLTVESTPTPIAEIPETPKTETTPELEQDLENYIDTTHPEMPDIDSASVEDSVSKSESAVISLDGVNVKTPSGLKVRQYNKSTVVNFAYLSFEYEESESKHSKYLDTIYDEKGIPIVSESDARLSSPSIKEGDTLEIKVDKSYKDFEILSKSPDTTPIGIYLKGEDKPIAYVHTLEWVSQNVAPDYIEGVLIDTKAIREAALKDTQNIVITGKSIGQLNRIENQGETNNKGYINSVSSAFGTQDKSQPNRFGNATIVVAKSEDIAITGHNSTSENNIINKMYPGVIYAEIPTSVPNNYFATFLKVATINNLNQTPVIIRAIQMHLEKNGTKLNGHNLDTVKGLSDFINEITFVGKGSKRNAKTFDINTTEDTLFFNIGATTDVGFDLTLSPGQALTKLDDVADQLKTTFNSKYFNISKDKLDSKEPYTLYKLDGSDIVPEKEYSNYSEFLAEKVLTTNLHPQILPSGERTYFHQSVIAYNLEDKTKDIKVTEKQIDEASTINTDEESKVIKKSEPNKDGLYDDADDSGLDDLSTNSINLSPVFNRTDLKYYRIQDLNLEQQNDITNSITALILKEIENGNNPNVAFSNSLKKFKGAYNKAITEGQNDKAKIIKLVIENWSNNNNFTGFINLTELKLAQLSTRIDGEELQVEEGTLEKRNFSEDSTFKTNPKDTASGRLKAFLSFVPRLDRKSIIGTDSYYDFNELYNEIMTYLADTEFDNMLGELQDLATVKPQFQTVISRLLQQDKALQNEFFSNFKKRYSEQLQINFEMSENGTTAKTRSSNRSSLTGSIITSWEENLKNSPILSQITEGDNIGSTKIDKDAIEKIHKEFTSIANLKTLTDENLVKLEEVFKKIGIDISVDALKDLKKSVYINRVIDGGTKTVKNNRKELSYKDLQSFLKNEINYIFTDLTKADEDALFEDNNPFINQAGRLGILANFQKRYEVQLQSSSYKDALGNTIFAYNNPTYYSDQLLALTAEDNEDLINKLLATPFASTSDFLKQLKDKKSALSQTFNITRFDATRKSRSNENALEFSEMPKKLRELTKLWLFQNQGSTTAKITDITYSDKKITNLISVPKIKTSDWSNPNSQAFTMLRNLLVGELMRIKQAQQQIENLPKDQLIDKYHTDAKGGLISFLFPSINTSALFEEGKRNLKQEYIDGPFLESYNTNGIILPEIKQIIDDTILSEVSSWINHKVDTLRTEGVTHQMFDKSYLYEKKDKRGINNEVADKTKLLEYGATDYVINYAITIGNMIQIMHGDIALAGKKGSHTEGYIRNTYIEYFKRMAKDIAPGIEAKALNPLTKVIYVNDVKIETEASKIFNKKLESTDAQAVVTTKFYITKLFERGGIKESLYNSILSKIESYPNNYDIHFTKEESSIFLQPRKPVYVKGNIENGINNISYLKFSDYPMLPSLTKDTNMDKVRKSMEYHKADMLIFKSGVKLGSKNPLTLYNNETGEFTFDESNLGNHVVDLDSSGFRIQQDNPLKDEDRIIEATQQKKLLFVDISGDTKFGDKTRTELKKDYDTKHIELINLKWEKLLNRFDATKLDNQTYQITDMTKFQEFIKETAISKGWNPNELAMLELTEDKSRFKIPLIYANSTEKIESLLTSLLTSNLTRVKLPGKAFIQASSIGYEGATKNVISDPALKYMQSDETGVYSEVAIAWPYRDLNYSNYVNEDGTPKSSIAKELLYLIGYRIPNQGHNSMLRLKVAKFLSPQLGDLMLVPSEVTMQMGSDFDVDKFNTYSYNVTVKDDKLVPYKGDDKLMNLENNIIDINHQVLSNKEVNEKVKQPLDSESLKEIAHTVDKLLHSDKQITSILNDEVSDKALADNKSGKLLTALTSLSATNHALAQEAGLFITPTRDEVITILFKDDNGKTFDEKLGKTKKGTYPTIKTDLPTSITSENSIGESEFIDREIPKNGAWRLDKVLGFTGVPISKVISGIQSAAVDNAKEQLLGMTNLNSTTYSVADLIIRTGFDESFLVPFMKQEAITELVNRIEKFNDPTQESTSRTKLDEVKSKLLSEYETKAEESINEITAFSREEMSDLLKTSIKADKDKQYYKAQAQILYNFLQYEKIAREITSLKASLSPESSGVGKSLTEVLHNQERIERAQSSFKYLGNTPNFFHGTAIGNTLDKAIFEGNALYKNLYPYADKAYNGFYEQIQNELGEDVVITLELKDELNRELRSGIYSKFYENVKEERTRLLIDEFIIDPKTNSKIFKKESLAQRVFNYTGDNRFLRKLKTELAIKSGEASYILYFSSAAEEQGEGLENSIAWQEALQSSDSIEMKLAEDLIKYAYLTGGAQTKSGFIKYVPTDYIENKLKGSSFVNFYESSTFDNIFRQYFQHRPWRAKKLNPKLNEIILDKSDKETPDRFTVDSNSEQATSLLVNIRNKVALPQFLSLKAKGKWMLYESTGVDQLGNLEYTRINLLGGFNFKEYDITAEKNSSILASNNTKIKAAKAGVGGADLKSTTSEPLINQNPSKIVQSIQSNNISEALDEIVKADNKYSALAKFFSDKVAGINIHEDNTSNDRKGYQQGNNVYINVRALELYFGEEGIHETVLHEIAHSLTAGKIDLYKTDKSKLTTKELEAIESLDRLRSVSKSKLSGKSDKHNYAVNSIEEFITYALTDEEFQSDLNSIQFNNKQTLLDRLFEIINRLLGINAAPGSVLEEALHNVLSIIDKTTQEEEVHHSPLFNIDKLQRIAKHYLVNASGYFSDKIQVNELRKTLREAGLADIVVKETSNKGGYYLSRNGKMINPLSINFSPIFAKKAPKTTGDIGLDKILNRWENQLRILKQQQTKNPEQNAVKQREIDEVKKTIEDLLDKKELGLVLDRAKIQLKQVDNLLTKSTHTSETLSKALNYIAGWEDINSIFTFAAGSEEAKTIGAIVTSASDMRNKWAEAAKNYLVQLAKSEGLKYTKKEMFEGNFDTSLATSLWFDSSISEVPLEILLDRIYKRTIFKANEEISEKHKEITEKFKPIKNKVGSLIQTKEDGTLTGNLISKYKQEYYDKVKELRSATKEDPRKWKEYWKWVKDNSYILSTKEAIEGKSDKFTKEELTKAKELLEQYDKDLAKYKEEEAKRLSYSDTYIDKDTNETIELDYQRNLADNIAEWERINSPYIKEKYDKDFSEGKRKGSELKGMKGYKYLLYPKPKENWEDPKYNTVVNDPALLEFYNYFKDTIEEYLEHLPNVSDVQSNTIPELRKTLREKYISDEFAKALQGVGDKMIESVTTDDLSDKEYGVIDEETGKPVRILKAGMLANKLSPTEKSYNLEKVLKEFVSIGASIKFKSQVESELQLGEKMLFEVTENLKGTDGPKVDWQNKVITLSNGLDNTRKRVSYLMDTFYGMRKEIEGKGKKPIESGPLKGKTIVGSKVADNVISYTVTKGLALNPFSAGVNVIFASISNRMEAAGGRSFTDSELTKAEAIAFGSIFNHANNRKKIALLMEKLQILGDTNQSNYGDKSVLDWTFFMQHMGEYAAQSAGMIANLIHRGIWDKVEVKGDELIFPEGTDVFKLSLSIQQLHKYLHGNYQLNSPSMIKKQWWGRMLMVFRNWIPYSLKNRFGAEFKDEALGYTKKGRYLSYGTLGLKSIPTLFKLSLLGRLTGAKVEGVAEVDLVNMKQNLRELSYMASFYLATMMMKAMAGGLDDDEDEILNYAINTAIRTEGDLWFFVSPKAFNQITKDPIPPLKTANDFIALIGATGSFIIGDDKIKSGRNKGKSNLFRATGKAFPITNQAIQLESTVNQVFSGKGQ